MEAFSTTFHDPSLSHILLVGEFYKGQIYDKKLRKNVDLPNNFTCYEGFYSSFNHTNGIYDVSLKGMRSFLSQNIEISKKEFFDEYIRGYCIKKYTTGAVMPNHTDPKPCKDALFRMVLLAPKTSKRDDYDGYYEGGELIVEGKTFISSNDYDVWTAVYIPYNVEHEVKIVTDGIRYIIKLDVMRPPFVPKVSFRAIEEKICKEKVEELNILVIEKQIEELEKQKEEIANKIYLLKEKLDYEDHHEEYEIDNIIKKVKEGNTVAVIMRSFYSEEGFNISDIKGYDRNSLHSLLNMEGLKYSLVNVCVDLFIGDGRGDRYKERMCESVIKCDGKEPREDGEYERDNIVKQISKCIGERNLYVNGAGEYGKFGQRIESESRYNDEYYSTFELYDVSIIYFKQ